MCEKCEQKRERLQKLLDEDEVLSQDQEGTIASMLAFGVDALLEKSQDPYVVEQALKTLMMMSVAKSLRKKLDDPKFQAQVEEMRKDLEESMAERVLKNMPEPKMVH